jgi:hypothetical protein
LPPELPRRLQNSAGVAGTFIRAIPLEIAANRRCVLREAFAPLDAASLELAIRRGVRP